MRFVRNTLAAIAVVVPAVLCAGQVAQGQVTQATSSPAPPKAATEPASRAAPRPPGLDALIRDLSDPEWKVREGAQEKILALGDGVLEPMREVLAGTKDPEVEQRAQNIIRKFRADRRAREMLEVNANADLSKPTLVSLSLSNAPAREAFESLFKQSNVPLKTWPPGLFDQAGIAGRPVTVELEKVPFWKAIAALEAQTGLSVRDVNREMVVSSAVRSPQRAGSPEPSLSGPFMVRAAGDMARGSMNSLTVFVEPRFRVVGYSRTPEIEQMVGPAVAGGGEAAAMAAQRARLVGAMDMDSFPSGNVLNVHMNQVMGPMSYLKGSVRVRVLTREQRIEIDEIAAAQNAERKVDGRRFLVNTMTPDAGDYLITLVAYDLVPQAGAAGALKGAPAGAAAIAQSQMMNQARTRLVDAEGNEYQPRGRSMSGGENGRLDFSLSFRQGPGCGPPTRLVVEVPVETKDVKVPFEFGDPPPGQEKQDGADPQHADDADAAPAPQRRVIVE